MRRSTSDARESESLLEEQGLNDGLRAHGCLMMQRVPERNERVSREQRLLHNLLILPGERRRVLILTDASENERVGRAVESTFCPMSL
jgi:hypothetical protein